ncbi:hypothetical protein D7Y13_30365 [Corallococcus praedator]|uniref:ATP-binding protein n=2 Tax=Myxococcaceae TaxID=31 RepID=A0ABX9Q9L2_9BACT|nr:MULTISPECIES: hypothetical protein [Corallococcus]RKH06971.1 hypothetical protein D7X74_33355 [Corallococcus sp. CA047B]RKH22976.1 hypothetical protein D7X75_34550 [Corallococcus sp. CA031C]RKH96869.1 hypothetical protein D7Y13_30365 [Corallococcus praedator]
MTPEALDKASGVLARDGLLLGRGEGAAPQLVLFDGRLNPAHAALLEREPPALLLATRDPGGQPSSWEVRLLGALLRGGALVPEEASVSREVLGSVADVTAAGERAAEAVIQAGGSKVAASRVADVVHEIGVNALLDAPVDDAGQPKYAHRRGQVQAVAEEDRCLLSWAVVDGRAWLEATDRFGRLTTSPLVRVVKAWGEKAQVDASGGGAGLGLRRILEHSDAVAVRVSPGRKTQFACGVDLGDARRRAAQPKSLLFCLERG